MSEIYWPDIETDSTDYGERALEMAGLMPEGTKRLGNHFEPGVMGSTKTLKEDVDIWRKKGYQVFVVPGEAHARNGMPLNGDALVGIKRGPLAPFYRVQFVDVLTVKIANLENEIKILEKDRTELMELEIHSIKREISRLQEEQKKEINSPPTLRSSGQDI